MKKYLLMISFFVCALVLNISSVKAITVTELVNQLENSDFVNSLTNSGTNVNIVFEENNNQIVINYPNSSSHKTIFEHENNSLLYTFRGDKNKINTSTTSTMQLDSSFVAEIFIIVSKSNGYSENEILELSKKLDNYTYANNGVEVKYFNYSFSLVPGVSDPIDAKGLDSFKINLKNINLDQNTDGFDNQENQNDQENVTDEPVDNPKTGTISIISLIVIGSIGGISLYLLNKKNKVHKI